MFQVIDTPWRVTRHLAELTSGSVRTVIRYFNHSNSAKLPEKRVSPAEAQAIAAAGLSLCTVFQQRGGSGGNISDLDAASGHADAARALQLAADIGQPEGSVIYFAVDHDYSDPGHIATILDYFAAIHHDFAGRFRVGVYGSGLIGGKVQDAGHASHIWLAAATGWSGTRDLLKTDRWALLQKWPPVAAPVPHDGNIVSGAWPDFGQFVPGQGGVLADVHATPVLMEVIASGGLNLRRGPGESFPVERTLPLGSLVHGLRATDKWVLVDADGDGSADGHMHGGFLAAVSGGFPAPAVTVAAESLSPYDVARAELALEVVEFPGAANNPRIVMYHQSTNMNAGTADSVAWCSSFVNYAVEAAGMIGTNSQWALTWADWGAVATSPKEGDIVVFERVGEGGHVGFLCRDLGEQVEILGGNQSNRVRRQIYPKDGMLGGQHYRMVSIRRG